MGKLIGTVLILLGCAGLLEGWRARQRRRQRTAAEFMRLLGGWGHSLQREKMRLLDFLTQFAGATPQMQAFLAQLCQAIAERRSPTGEELWRCALEENRRPLELDDALFELLLPAGGAFFGRCREENIQCALASRKRLEEQLADEQAEFKRKQKVYMPVGMLGGLLLVIYLL